ncbi:hypothetical protein EZH22_09860 [Xanthobacter dioxanivorans]|uniref:Uncharacterized protein n=1 Tax=Xanthobacter dioxanivorans TaxID=2528964 RepID=A0A974SKJ8_9HYPH|nr:hypothetical protein [Xanthobacter dioxanivorans]QRG08557.1 hypothetical protein EZH22_09860 [Xanthobacter dioxanivorans]
MQPELPESGRGRLIAGLFALILTLVLGGAAAALLVNGYRARVEESARRDALVIGTSVARVLAQQFEKASRFGIPLKLLPGVEVHLSETLARTPGLTQIVLRGADGREIRSAIGEQPGTDSVSAPVSVDGNTVASVEVTTNPAALATSFADIGVKAAVVVVICAALAALAAGLLVGAAIERARDRLATGMIRAIEGDFGGPAETGRRPRGGMQHGAVGGAFRALERGNRRVAERRSVFEAYAEELLAVDFDGGLRPDVERVRREVMAPPAESEKGRRV